MQLQKNNNTITNERYIVCKNDGKTIVSYNTILGEQAAYKYAKIALNQVRDGKLYYQGEDGLNKLLEDNSK